MTQYNLIFQGEIVDGDSLDSLSLEKTKSDIAKLFNADAEKTAKLFSGKAIVIKKNLHEEACKKYIAMLKKSGAIVHAVRQETKQEEPSNNNTSVNQIPTTPSPQVSSGRLSPGLSALVNYNHAVQPPQAEANTTISDTATNTNNTDIAESNAIDAAETGHELQLEPENSATITPENHTEAVEIADISHLSMSQAQTGSLEEFATQTTPVEIPDISDLSMSEAQQGTLEGIEKKPEAVEIPDISDLSMSEAQQGTLEGIEKKPEAVEIPDISDLSMSEAQQGTLEGIEKKPEAVEIPDISHLDFS